MNFPFLKPTRLSSSSIVNPQTFTFTFSISLVVCKEFGNPISDVLRGRDSSTYSVVNVESGVPSYLVDYFGSETFEGIHVPYIIIAQGNSILYAQRVESYEILEDFKSTFENINI